MILRTLSILIIILLTSSEIIPQPWWNNTYSAKTLDISKVKIPINNFGGIESTVWDHNSRNHYIVFDQGLWVVGKINNRIHLTLKQWRSSYSPGPIINNDAVMNIHPEDSAKFRVYKIGVTDTINPGKDYLEWPSDMGAPVNSHNLPVIYNHQTAWTIYNSLDSSLNDRKVWNQHIDSLPVFPIEVQQLVYASEYGQQDWIRDIVFFEWLIINKGSEPIDSAYFGLWSDIDFNELFNIPAVDTALSLGYCWSPVDSGYFIPLTVGYLFKYGPIIPSPGDTAIFNGSKRNNYKNLNITSFHGIGDDSILDPIYGPARSVNAAWNFAKGLDANGNPIINPTTGQPTKFPANGDPVTNTGYIFPAISIGGGAGLVMFTGPVNIAPNDSQWVMAALVVSSGDDYKDAIVKLREKAGDIQSMNYDRLVTKHSALPPPYFPPKQFYLSQNFPNPFNNGTKIFFDMPYSSNVIISVYDMLGKKVTEILNEVKAPGSYEVSFNLEEQASGVYFYQILAPDGPGYFIQTKKMILLK
ncbi:MAG: T9SS type A sorting domain-containing protein [Ignavibacteriaceae bacterium]